MTDSNNEKLLRRLSRVILVAYNRIKSPRLFYIAVDEERTGMKEEGCGGGGVRRDETHYARAFTDVVSDLVITHREFIYQIVDSEFLRFPRGDRLKTRYIGRKCVYCRSSLLIGDDYRGK